MVTRLALVSLLQTAWHAPVLLVLRSLTISVGLYQLLFGEHIIGIFMLLSVLAIFLPSLITRHYIRFIPREFEILLFLIVILQFVIGESLRFYYIVPYYDKFVHVSLPLFIGLMGFMLAYALSVTNRLKISVAPLVVLIVLFTLGIGAIWEIMEYLHDTVIYPYFDWLGKAQGSLTEDPFSDTMHDLIADLVGGIFGAVIGLRYIQSERGKRRSRLSRLVGELADNFRKHEQPL
jgi:hypothetical protein